VRRKPDRRLSRQQPATPKQAPAPVAESPARPSRASDAPLREPASGAITLLPSMEPPPTVSRGDEERPSAQQQATRLVQQIAAEHQRARQPPNTYFREMRQLLEEMWKVELLLAARRDQANDGDTARVRLIQRPDGALLEVALVTP